ncbi:MAG: DUF5317 family protein [Chloroflexota bacterium]
MAGRSVSNDDLLLFLPVFLILGARILWQRRPGLLPCALFWGTSAVLLAVGWQWAISQFVLIAGIASNAIVTLANGGFMPVATHRKLAGPARSVWVQKSGDTRLNWLGDNFGNRFVRFSIGDVLLLAGIIVSIAGY